VRAERTLPLISAVAAGIAVLALTLVATGHDPVVALGAMWRGAFGSWDTILSAVLPRSIPLIVIGLGIGLAFRAGALNIGAEGQFYAGAIAATWAGLHLNGWPAPLAIAALLTTSILAGVLWVAVPVLLRVRFGVLEVISTLLLNFVADALVSWMVQGPLQEAKRIYPQSDPIAASARLPQVPGTRLHLGLLLAIGLAVVLWVIYRRTLWGFQLRATGAGPLAAGIAGRIDTKKMLATALLLSGGIAGLAGGIEVSGVPRSPGHHSNRPALRGVGSGCRRPPAGGRCPGRPGLPDRGGDNHRRAVVRHHCAATQPREVLRWTQTFLCRS
jgi:simple sugar transport system permease protein